MRICDVLLNIFKKRLLKRESNVSLGISIVYFDFLLPFLSKTTCISQCAARKLRLFSF